MSRSVKDWATVCVQSSVIIMENNFLSIYIYHKLMTQLPRNKHKNMPKFDCIAEGLSLPHENLLYQVFSSN